MIHTFAPSKIHSLLHLLQDGNKKVQYFKLIKLLFLAERWHMRNYGVMMTGDTPCGLPRGSILSKSLNYLKERRLSKDKTDKDFFLVRLDTPSETDLSKSETKAVEFSLSRFSKFTALQLGMMTHAYPEYDRFEFMIKQGGSQKFEENPILFFSDPDPRSENYVFLETLFGRKDPFEDDPEFLESVKQNYICNVGS